MQSLSHNQNLLIKFKKHMAALTLEDPRFEKREQFVKINEQESVKIGEAMIELEININRMEYEDLYFTKTNDDNPFNFFCENIINRYKPLNRQEKQKQKQQITDQN